MQQPNASDVEPSCVASATTMNNGSIAGGGNQSGVTPPQHSTFAPHNQGLKFASARRDEPTRARHAP